MRNRRRGASAVEFSLLAGLTIGLLSGVIDYGWILFHQSALDSSISAGCRAGALVDPGEGEVDMDTVFETADEAVKDALLSYGAGGCGSACTTQVEAYGERPGRSLLCSVSRDIQPVIGLVAPDITLESSIAVRMEWQRED